MQLCDSPPGNQVTTQAINEIHASNNGSVRSYDFGGFIYAW